MNAKSRKIPLAAPKNAARKTKVETPLEEDLTKNALQPVREGADNLRQREEWFRRRTDRAE